MESLNYFKALSDITRIRLLNVLISHELSVNELVNLMEMGQSRISRHLKILTDAGLLECRRDGIWAFYLPSAEGPGRKVIQSIRYLLDDEPQLQQDLMRTKGVIQDRKQKTMQFFNGIASRWDLLRKEVLGDFDLNAAIMKELSPSHVAVDLGCGTGELMENLIKISQQVIGVDSSSKMLEQARDRFHSDGEKIDLRLGELENLPLKNGEADCAIVSMVLHHLSDPGRLISEVGRVLRNNGTFIIVDFEKHRDENLRKTYGDRWLGFSRQEIMDMVKPNGFVLKKFRRFNIGNQLALNLYKALMVRPHEA